MGPVALALAAGVLGLGGAATALNAAVFACIMLVCVALSAGLISPGAREAAARRAAPCLAAFAIYAVFGLASAVPLSASVGWLWHPYWSEFGLAPGAISIAPHRVYEGLTAACGGVAGLMIGILLGAEQRAREPLRRFLIACPIAFTLCALLTRTTAFDGRLLGGLPSPNIAATFLVATTLYCAADGFRLLQSKARNGVLFTVAALLVSLGGLILTESRAGLAALLVGAVAFVWLVRAPWVLRLGVIGGGVGAVVAAVLLGRWRSLIADFTERSDLWSAHGRLALERPILGHGLGSFQELNARALDSQSWAANAQVGSAHNLYLQAFEESGVFALALLAVVGWPLLSLVWRIVRRDRADAWGAAAAAAAVAAGAHALFDFGLQTPAVAATLGLGLGAFAWRGARSEEVLSSNALLGWRVAPLLFGVGALWVALHAAGAQQPDLAARLESSWHAQVWRVRATTASTSQARLAALEASLRRSPLQADAWAALSVGGSALCEPSQCLQASYFAAPSAAPELACARLSRAIELGLLRPEDPKVAEVLAREDLGASAPLCLSALPEDFRASLLFDAWATRLRQP